MRDLPAFQGATCGRKRLESMWHEAVVLHAALPCNAQAREAVQQLAEMSRLGVQPDSMLGTALVDACARSGQMQMAQAAFEELFGEACHASILHGGIIGTATHSNRRGMLVAAQIPCWSRMM